jgi:hypothetical protein
MVVLFGGIWHPQLFTAATTRFAVGFDLHQVGVDAEDGA